MSVVTPPFCDESDQMTLTVVDYNPGNVVTGNQTICYATSPTQLEVTAASGGVGNHTYQWQVSTDNVNYTDIVGATGLAYLDNTLQLTEPTYYYRNVQSCDCGSKFTPVITVNVYDEFIAGNIDSPLTEKGILQAKALIEPLKK